MARHGLFPKDVVARRFDLTLPTIDFYISKGLLQPIQLDDGTYLTASDFIRIEIIQMGKKLGFSLAEIKKLIDSYSGPESALPH